VWRNGLCALASVPGVGYTLPEQNDSAELPGLITFHVKGNSRLGWPDQDSAEIEGIVVRLAPPDQAF